MHLNIEHKTRYAFDAPVDYTIQKLHLTPQDGFGQRVKHWEIRVNGRMQSHADPFGNTEHTLVLDTPHSEISITASGEVETGLDTPPQADTLPLQVYLRATPLTSMDAGLMDFAHYFGNPGAGLNRIELHALLRAVRDRVTWQAEPLQKALSAAEAFAAGAGNAREHAHVFIAACRYLGVPARYVSGYLFNGEGLPAQSHSWADVWLDGAWLSYDISSGKPANGIHLRLATGLDDRDACPFKVMSRHAEQSVSSSVIAHSMEQSQQ